MSSIEKALQGAALGGPLGSLGADELGSENRRDGASRSILVLGATGRLGEAIVAELLSGSSYQSVYVLADKPIDSGGSRLKPVFATALPTVTDLLIHVEGALSAFGSSQYGRDKAFVQVQENSVLEWLSRTLETAPQIKRVALVRAFTMMEQMGGVGAGLMTDYEYAAHRSSAESVLIFRPTPLYEPTPTRTFFSRFLNFYRVINLFTMPKAFEPMTSASMAKVVASALLDATPGLEVLTAERMRGKLAALTDS